MIINPMITIYVWLTIGGLALIGFILWKWYFNVDDYDDETNENDTNNE